jgi:hypothetical protein
MIKRTFWRTLIAGLVALVVVVNAVPSAAASTFHITLVQIECLDKEDSTINGADEPYIEINGSRVWSGSGFRDGDSENSLGTFLIGNTANVRLWEQDAAPDNDDLIGSVGVGASDAGDGTKTVILTGAGGQYSLSFRVF